MFKYLIIGIALLIPAISNAQSYSWCCGSTINTSNSVTIDSSNQDKQTPADIIRREKDKLEAQSRDMQKKWFDFSNERSDLETRLNQYRDALRKLEQSSDVPSSPIPPVKPEEKN